MPPLCWGPSQATWTWGPFRGTRRAASERQHPGFARTSVLPQVVLSNFTSSGLCSPRPLLLCFLDSGRSCQTALSVCCLLNCSPTGGWRRGRCFSQPFVLGLVKVVGSPGPAARPSCWDGLGGRQPPPRLPEHVFSALLRGGPSKGKKGAALGVLWVREGPYWGLSVPRHGLLPPRRSVASQ